jgi:tRNA-intron endonuclease
LNIDKYFVFKDLVNKNFVVKSGLKYGAHFRVYLKKDYENKEHSKYLVYVLNPKKLIGSEELIVLFRTAHSVKKRVIFAFIDEEGSIIYYESKWLRI